MQRLRTIRLTRKPRNTGSVIDRLFQKIQETRKYLDLLKEDVENVKKLHGEILATPIVHDQRAQELDTLNSQIKYHSIAIKNKLKEVKKAIIEQEDKDTCQFVNEEKYKANVATESCQLMSRQSVGAGESASLRIHKNQYSTYLRIYTEVINEYNEAQIQHRDKCRSRLKRQLEITNATCSEDQIDNMIEEGNFAVFTQGIVSETKEAKRVLQDLKARHTDLMKLEKSIVMLHDLFADIAVQIEYQGDTVDSIATSVENTAAYVEKAKIEVAQATEFKRSFVKKKLILASAGAILLLIIVLAVVIYFTV